VTRSQETTSLLISLSLSKLKRPDWTVRGSRDLIAEVWSTSCDSEESPALAEAENVLLRPLGMAHPSFARHSIPDLGEALRSDLIILEMSGINPRQGVADIIDNVGERQWKQRRARIVFRSQDSHHQLSDELSVLDQIDYFAIAHGPYLENFPDGRAFHVPCSLHQNRTIASGWARKTPTEKEVDVVFPFQLYRGEVRNALAYEISRELQKRGHSARFGFFRYNRFADSPPKLWEEMGRARVILNLPLRDDLNIRNFEASLFPSWHVTVKVSDHERVDMDWSNTVFVHPQPRAIADTISDLLDRDSHLPEPSMSPSQEVLHHHTSNDRVYQIIDHVFGTALTSRPTSTNREGLIKVKPVIEEIYSSSKMLEKSPTLFTRLPETGGYRPSLWLRVKSTIIRVVTLPQRIAHRLFSKN